MRKRTAFDWACLVFIISFLCITVFPFVWIIITSFKTNADIHGAATYARKLLGYRYQILNQARENARRLGHSKGALFPWRTINGKECSYYYPSGGAQYHIIGDIAYGIIQYYLITGDWDYMAQQGGEIVMETARIWYDLGNFYQGKFHIHCVTGPDEYTCVVNNNYYTNLTAKHNLTWAKNCMSSLIRTGS